MSSSKKHLDQYKHNKSLLQLPAFNPSSSTENCDWTVTIAFYCSVHLVEKVLAETNSEIHCKSHTERQQWVRREKSLKPIANKYLTLYIQSRRARYDCVKFSKKEAEDIIALLESIAAEFGVEKVAM